MQIMVDFEEMELSAMFIKSMKTKGFLNITSTGIEYMMTIRLKSNLYRAQKILDKGDRFLPLKNK